MRYIKETPARNFLRKFQQKIRKQGSFYFRKNLKKYFLRKLFFLTFLHKIFAKAVFNQIFSNSSFSFSSCFSRIRSPCSSCLSFST